jgi:hypothetical protein
MSPVGEGTEPGRPDYIGWLRGTLVFLAVLVVARFVLEIAGVSGAKTRFVSSNAALFLAAVYLGAVASLRGVTKFVQLILPAVIMAAWTAGWIILATLVSAVFRLERSHFAVKEDYGNWGHLGRHVVGHLVELGIFAVVVLILMAILFLLRHWPVTVGPAALLGALVIVRYWVEAMGVEPWGAAAWSSTVGVLLCGFYLGGIGPRLGLTAARQLLVPGLVLGWTWRLWVFIATVFAALVPFYRTHFFDPSKGRIAIRLAQSLGASVVQGFIAGLLVWGIAVWIARATRPAAEV